MSLISQTQVILDLAAPDRHEATRTLATTLVADGRCTDLDLFLSDVRKREEQMATGLPGGIGIPHARSAGISTPSLVFGRSREGIDWGPRTDPPPSSSSSPPRTAVGRRTWRSSPSSRASSCGKSSAKH